MIIFFLYNVLLLLFFPLFLFFYISQSVFLSKKRAGIFRKLGFYTNKDIKAPFVIHCVSVGETLSVVPFVKKLSELIKKNIVFTTTTYTGWAVANDKVKSYVQKIEYFPFDFIFSVIMFYTIYKPSCIILTETEIWPNMIYIAKFKNIPLFIINGRISDRSFPRYKAFKFFFKTFLDYPYFLMQTESDKSRVIEMGALSERTFVIGNIKYDVVLPQNIYKKADFGFNEDDFVFLAGSTHDGEEVMILNAFKNLKKKYQKLKLIIAPRHPERFTIVEKILIENGETYVKRTENKKVENIMILNTIGELKNVYAICDIAFIGGSLVDIGGHNIIEPAIFEKPVLFGPYMSNFRDISEEFVNNGAGLLVDNGNFYDALSTLIESETLRLKMGKKAKQIVLKNAGSVDRTIDYILGKLNAL
jgi:3-deoxy-D-manno-octulosonic-acid transferase